MMSLRDTLILALTKLRTRRVRLIITLIMSGLLFSVLIVSSLTVRGLVSSVNSYTKDGLLKRFYVMTTKTSSTFFSDPTSEETTESKKILARAIAINDELIAKKTAAAKKLGVPYDPTSEPKPYEIYAGPGGTEAQSRKMLNASHPAAIQAIKELTDTKAFAKAVEAAGRRHGAINTYVTHPLSGPNDQVSINLIINNQEVAETDQSVKTGFTGQDITAEIGSQIVGLDPDMFKDYVLPGADQSSDGGVIPIVVAATAAEKLTGLTALPATASSVERLNHLKELRAKSVNLVFQGCYRNPAAASRYSEAMSQAKQIEVHAKDSGFQMPDVVYEISNNPCQPVTISKDTRTAAAKLEAAKLEDFNAQFGLAKPQTSSISFRIVGLVSTPNYDATGFSISNLVQTMLTSTQISNYIVPTDALKKHPVLGALDFSDSQEVWGSNVTMIEFADREHQKDFLVSENCNIGFDYNACNQPDKFIGAPYGNPIAVLYEARDGAMSFLMWVLGIIATLSALIMMGTIGKVIADSRKETSVFRALGATRPQIAQIYLLYALMLGGLSFGLALIAGSALAVLIDMNTSPQLSVEAATALNTANLDKQFHLIGWNPSDLGLILGLILLTALAGAVLPLLTNIRRNPINDMRSE